MRRQPGALPPVSVQDTEHEVELPSSSQRSSKSPDQARSPASANSSAVQTGRLFLRNLAFTVTRQEILDAFCCFGEIQEVGLAGRAACVRFITDYPPYVAFRFMCQVNKDAIKA